MRASTLLALLPMAMAAPQAKRASPAPLIVPRGAELIAGKYIVKMKDGTIAAAVSGAISKTINLPNDAAEVDVANAYRLAWEVGCLGITVFRDGCKGEQVLNVGIGKKDKPPAQLPTTGQVVIKPRPHSLSGMTYRMETPIGTAFITVNETPDGEPFEVFVQVG